MSQPTPHEIEAFVKDRFNVARSRLLEDYEIKKTRALAEVRLTRNAGSYQPVITEWAAERMRALILALADAYVEALNLFGLASDSKTEADFRKTAVEIAAGTISGLQGEIVLNQRRTTTPSNTCLAYSHRQIERASHKAVDEGFLKLRQQRIEIQYPKPMAPKDALSGSSLASWAATKKAARQPQEAIAKRRKTGIMPKLKERHLSRSGWAVHLGFDPSVVLDYLSGKSFPRERNAKLMADDLGLDALPQ